MNIKYLFVAALICLPISALFMFFGNRVKDGIHLNNFSWLFLGMFSALFLVVGFTDKFGPCGLY